jgi:hypothetical protein
MGTTAVPDRLKLRSSSDSEHAVLCAKNLANGKQPVFDQWVPDETEPRKRARTPRRLFARLSATAIALVRAVGGAAGAIGRGEGRLHLARSLAPHLGHHLWAHVTAIAGVVLVTGAVLLGPERAHGDQRLAATLALFQRTGGDLGDHGMAVLSALDPSAALIANRLAPLPPPPGFRGEQGSADDELPTPPVLNLPGMTPDQARAINASIPFSSLPNPAARPFFIPPTNLLDATRAVDCLTAAIYYEAGNESLEGQQAVAQVILNRMRHPAFPKSVCGVVFQGSNKTTGCQFTFTCDGSLFRKPNDAHWARSRLVAVAALNGYVMKAIGNATHYHADYVAPYWSTSLIKVGKIGAHIFYRWTGGWGQPRAFDAGYAGGELQMMAASGMPLDPNLSVTLPATDAGLPDAGEAIRPTPTEADLAKLPAKIEIAPEGPTLITPAPIVEAKPEPKKAPPPRRHDSWSRLPVPH